MSAITCYHRAPTQSTMNRHCKTTASVIRSVNELAIIPRLRDLSRSLLSSNVCTNAIRNKDAVDSHQLEAIFQQKRLLRSKIRKDLKNMDPIQRSQEDNVIQNIVIESSWFKDSRNLCAYISCAALREVDTSRIVSEILSNPINAGSSQLRKKLYVPRVEDKKSNMKMLKISSVNDLIANSMNILEPPLTDADGNQCEDVMQAREPLDLAILPGLAFDKSGGRLGRSGGYYDVFLKKYQKFAQERKWKLPLLVALSYSVQVMEEGSIPVTPGDVPVDALVSPRGFIPISPIALERYD